MVCVSNVLWLPGHTITISNMCYHLAVSAIACYIGKKPRQGREPRRVLSEVMLRDTLHLPNAPSHSCLPSAWSHTYSTTQLFAQYLDVSKGKMDKQRNEKAISHNKHEKASPSLGIIENAIKIIFKSKLVE